MSAPPFLPFTRPAIDEATVAGVADVLRSGWLTTGHNCRAFEAALSTYFGGRPIRVANSGTATLELALALCDIGAGDEVITTPLTWAATGNVIARRGARPVFVDVDPRTRNIDLARAEDAITPTTRAIVPVDLAGLPVRPRRALRLRQQLQPARDRGCSAIDGRQLEGPAYRQHRRPGLVQFSRQQEHDLPAKAAAWFSTTRPKLRGASVCDCRA